MVTPSFRLGSTLEASHEVGKLYFRNGKWYFEGDVDESARLFLASVNRQRDLSVFNIVFPSMTAAQAPSIPTRAFDVRNGNGVIDAGTTYPAAIVIPFKDAAAKQKWLDDYADNNNWENANPRPTKQAFALDGLKLWMRQQAEAGREQAQTKVRTKPDTSDLP